MIHYMILDILFPSLGLSFPTCKGKLSWRNMMVGFYSVICQVLLAAACSPPPIPTLLPLPFPESVGAKGSTGQGC